MANGNQQKQYSFQDWGWSLPDSISGEQQETPIEKPQSELPQYMYQNWGWDLPNKPQPVEKVEAENKKIEELHEPVERAGGDVGGVLSNFVMDKDIVTSEYAMLKKAASEGSPEAQQRIEALDIDFKRKQSFGEGSQYAMKRLVSIAPFVELLI